MGFRSAVAFLTVFPVGARDAGIRAGMTSARGWFPVVGLLIGILVAAVDLLVRWGYTGGSPDSANDSTMVHILAGTVIVAAGALVTGALHLDGFMDTCDALLGGTGPDHRRKILKDPHVGAFAVIAVTCLLLMKVAAVSVLPWDSRGWILVLVPCLSRGAMLLVMETFPYVGENGLGAEFVKRTGRGQISLGLIFCVAAGMILVGPWSLIMLALVALIGWLIGVWSTRLLGGVTGDIYGAVNETAEVTVLLLAALIAARWSAALSPSWFGLAEGWF